MQYTTWWCFRKGIQFACFVLHNILYLFIVCHILSTWHGSFWWLEQMWLLRLGFFFQEAGILTPSTPSSSMMETYGNIQKLFGLALTQERYPRTNPQPLDSQHKQERQINTNHAIQPLSSTIFVRETGFAKCCLNVHVYHLFGTNFGTKIRLTRTLAYLKGSHLVHAEGQRGRRPDLLQRDRWRRRS